jgi:flagellar biogenesis protein FliO
MLFVMESSGISRARKVTWYCRRWAVTEGTHSLSSIAMTAALCGLLFAYSGKAGAFGFLDVLNIDLTHQIAAAVHAQPTTEQATMPAQTPPPSIAVVSAPDRERLLQAIENLDQSSAHNATRNASLSLTLVIAAIGFGALSAVLAFCRASTIAGVLSILATTSVGANNSLPFNDAANTYKIIAAQAHALYLDASLNSPMSRDDYQSYKRKLVALATYGDQKSASGSAEELQKLIQQLGPSTGGAQTGH